MFKEIPQFCEQEEKIKNDPEDQIDKVEQKLKLLKEQDFAELDFNNIDGLSESLNNKEYFEQFVIIEKILRDGGLSLENTLKLFETTNDNKTKIAIIENISEFKNSYGANKCIEFLTKVSGSSYVNSASLLDESSELTKSYLLKKYPIDYEDMIMEIDEEVFLPAAIINLAKFGVKAEDDLMSIFDKHRFSPLLMNLGDEDEYDYLANRVNNFEYDDRYNLTSTNDKSFYDPYYIYNSLCLKQLARIGSKKSIDFAISMLNEDEDCLFIYNKELPEMLKIDKNYAENKIFETIEKNNLSEDQNFRLIIVLTDLITAEQTRQKLNELIEQNREQGDENAVDNLEYARSFITPNHDKIAIENLQTFYQEKIKFEEYGLNQKMNEKEVTLLQDLIDKDDKVLELGCGAGRLLLEMKKAGYDITGNDYVKRHVELIKDQNSEAKVFQGDWHHNAIKDKSFDKIYSLGRNILHDYSLLDQVQLFREARRMLKQGGQFIFDIPNREKGGYKMLVDEYAKEMQDRGIKNFRYGAIYDSPDGKNFTTRYAYSDEDIKELSRLTGFKIKEVKNKNLETGKGDENLYYVLEKI